MDRPVPALKAIEGRTVFKASRQGDMFIFEWTDGDVTAVSFTDIGPYIETVSPNGSNLQ